MIPWVEDDPLVDCSDQVLDDSLYRVRMRLLWIARESRTLVHCVRNFWTRRLLHKIQLSDDTLVMLLLVDRSPVQVSAQFNGRCRRRGL
jgi:hypothetical protein